jgi:hypothetical protein
MRKYKFKSHPPHLSLNSCLFLSQVFSCLTSNSSVFPLPFHLCVQRFCLLLVLICWIGLSFFLAVLFHFFSEVFHILGHFHFNILSLYSVLVVLMIICCGLVIFGSSLFGVSEASHTCMSIVFSRFGSFLLLFC